MVKEILREIEKNHGVVVLNDLAKKMNLDAAALEGILRTMNRSGSTKPVPVRCSAGTCRGCPLAKGTSNGDCGYRTLMILDRYT
jgi:hypothetical protein